MKNAINYFKIENFATKWYIKTALLDFTMTWYQNVVLTSNRILTLTFKGL